MDIVKQSVAYRLVSGDSFTISSNLNRIVIIGIFSNVGEASNITYNGQACTRITYGTITTSPTDYNSIWYYLPGTLAGGAYAVAGTNISRAYVWEFYNVNQASPILASDFAVNNTTGTTALNSGSMLAKKGGYLVSHVVMGSAQSAPYITCADGSDVDFEGGYTYAAISRALTSGGTATIGVSAFETTTKRCLASISLNPNKSTGAGITSYDGYGLL